MLWLEGGGMVVCVVWVCGLWKYFWIYGWFSCLILCSGVLVIILWLVSIVIWL